MTRLVTDPFEMIHSCNHPLWRGSIPQRLIQAGGMSLQDLDDEIARGEALERLSRPPSRDYYRKNSVPTLQRCAATGRSWWPGDGCENRPRQVIGKSINPLKASWLEQTCRYMIEKTRWVPRLIGSLDREVALARVGGDPELLKEIAVLFLENYQAWLSELRAGGGPRRCPNGGAHRSRIEGIGGELRRTRRRRSVRETGDLGPHRRSHGRDRIAGRAGSRARNFARRPRKPLN